MCDADVDDHLAPRERAIGMVFQDYALFPHMTVDENVAYGLRARSMPRAEVERRASREALAHRAHRGARRRKPRRAVGRPAAAGGARPRARVRPRVLLLDEPFGALDKKLRLDMQIEVKRLQRQLGITTILVTHDQEEALSMADRIAVMRDGRIEQVGEPGELYDRPAHACSSTACRHRQPAGGRDRGAPRRRLHRRARGGRDG